MDSFVEEVINRKPSNPSHRDFKYGDVVQHFKRENIEDKFLLDYVYMFVAIATHTETKEKFVVYNALYNNEEKGIEYGQTFIRPYDMFMSEVDHEKYPDIKQKYRFEYVTSIFPF